MEAAGKVSSPGARAMLAIAVRNALATGALPMASQLVILAFDDVIGDVSLLIEYLNAITMENLKSCLLSGLYNDFVETFLQLLSAHRLALIQLIREPGTDSLDEKLHVALLLALRVIIDTVKRERHNADSKDEQFAVHWTSIASTKMKQLLDRFANVYEMMDRTAISRLVILLSTVLASFWLVEAQPGADQEHLIQLGTAVFGFLPVHGPGQCQEVIHILSCVTNIRLPKHIANHLIGLIAANLDVVVEELGDDVDEFLIEPICRSVGTALRSLVRAADFTQPEEFTESQIGRRILDTILILLERCCTSKLDDKTNVALVYLFDQVFSCFHWPCVVRILDEEAVLDLVLAAVRLLVDQRQRSHMDGNALESILTTLNLSFLSNMKRLVVSDHDRTFTDKLFRAEDLCWIFSEGALGPLSIMLQSVALLDTILLTDRGRRLPFTLASALPDLLNDFCHRVEPKTTTDVKVDIILLTHTVLWHDPSLSITRDDVQRKQLCGLVERIRLKSDGYMPAELNEMAAMFALSSLFLAVTLPSLSQNKPFDIPATETLFEGFTQMRSFDLSRVYAIASLTGLVHLSQHPIYKCMLPLGSLARFLTLCLAQCLGENILSSDFPHVPHIVKLCLVILINLGGQANFRAECKDSILCQTIIQVMTKFSSDGALFEYALWALFNLCARDDAMIQQLFSEESRLVATLCYLVPSSNFMNERVATRTCKLFGLLKNKPAAWGATVSKFDKFMLVIIATSAAKRPLQDKVLAIFHMT